jgi:3-isopropylmalate dehydrogenase
MLKIGVMLGDDIGLEVVPETVKVMQAAAQATRLAIEWRELPLGLLGHKLHGHTMPQYTVEKLGRCASSSTCSPA